MVRNHYQVLQVAPGASQAEIEQAYRRLLKRYHPDTGGSTASVERFTAVRAAWSVLGDPVKRKAYDRQLNLAATKAERKAGSAVPPQQTTVSQASPWNAPPETTGKTRSGRRFQQIFHKVFRERYHKTQAPSPMDGRDVQVRVELDLENAFRGGRQRIRLPPDIHHPRRRVIEIDLPAGVRHGQVLRFPGLGFPGVAGGRTGDLLVKVLIGPHPRMQLEGKDVLYHLPVWPWELMLGAELGFQALGEQHKVHIPPGTPARTRLRLHGKGFGPAPRGDLVVLLEVCTPAPESNEKRQLLQQLAFMYRNTEKP